MIGSPYIAEEGVTEVKLKVDNPPVEVVQKSQAFTFQNIGIIVIVVAFFLTGMTVVARKFMNLKKGQEENKAVKSYEHDIDYNPYVDQKVVVVDLDKIAEADEAF